MHHFKLPPSAAFETITKAARERILVLDGAMGTQIQTFGLDEDAYRGVGGQSRNDISEKPQKGNNDLLSLTQPDVIEAIHTDFINAGADIVETNTFSSTTIAQADYAMEHAVHDLNVASVQVARRAVEKAMAKDGKQRWVAGAVGPTNRTASISPDVNDPGYRAVTFDDLRIAYGTQIRSLIEGGADIILIETIFDTLNAKAAIFASFEAFAEHGKRLPVMISGTITDASGRTLSGQTPTAFWHSVRHARPMTIGLNCALGADAMRPHLTELATVADNTMVCAYPNAGLPNAFGQYDEDPDDTGSKVELFAKEGLINVAGGCCGTTPGHIRSISERVAHYAPRNIWETADV